MNKYKIKEYIKTVEELCYNTDTVRVIINGWSGGNIYFVDNCPYAILAPSFTKNAKLPTRKNSPLTNLIKFVIISKWKTLSS